MARSQEQLAESSPSWGALKTWRRFLSCSVGKEGQQTSTILPQGLCKGCARYLEHLSPDIYLDNSLTSLGSFNW